MNLLIIPARGGSKRIPRKNIKNFKGKPIIEWAITESMKLNLFDKFIVSTDDEEIAEISAKAGFEIPFLRPKNLADDYTSTRDVVIHAINFFNEKNVEFEKVCCLYPTTPLLDAEDISNAFQILKKSQKNVYVFSASIYSHPIQRSFFIEKNGLSKMFFPESFCERTQDLKSAFHDAGQFYIASAKTWLNNKNIFENGLPYILPQSKSIDIDTLDDWKLAELMHAINKK
ncbi:pseudaminic acid cytidylyltransferase [Prochlorococcus marinus]|uniref:pseudaminic acid cytidylyltransferase n=1 Tax=Prochlorococcus marinus TaxID=1219 RepID=UPI001ADACDAE|nr:pseudaminic acid cytidylyltransferase [Prochlorococcus marinus]MBO8217660.1 pseudaminic acid cytidylyltransferase [Prochlorococcus marinus XMU1405]MBW3040822.1 pseudaminic acid cytidylyltransferase [Prochlorococcus marinus str. MU1405]MBW3048281.1 pseudaminic acid cytidylyltransferase [Prochlorococcus marinus str. MU1406]